MLLQVHTLVTSTLTFSPLVTSALSQRKVVSITTRTRYFNKLTSALSLDSPSQNYFSKSKLNRDNFYMLLNKTAQMFDYSNLPPTLPKAALELILQTFGSAVIWNVPSEYTPVGKGPLFNYSDLSSPPSSDLPNLYAFTYSLADAPDPYDEPYKVVITSPGFRPTISSTLELNTDCILIKNDSYMRGISWLHRKYAYLLTESEISLRSTLICLREQLTFIAKTEPQRAAVSKYISDREEGIPGSILAPDLGSPLEALQSDGRSNAVELAVNGRQAIYAAWYNEIGLNPSFSLKREYTSAQEIDTNTDLLTPTIDDMLYCREQACASINAMFGTEITVHKSSAWELKEQQIDNALDLEQAEIDSLVTSAETPPEEVTPDDSLPTD